MMNNAHAPARRKRRLRPKDWRTDHIMLTREGARQSVEFVYFWRAYRVSWVGDGAPVDSESTRAFQWYEQTAGTFNPTHWHAITRRRVALRAELIECARFAWEKWRRQHQHTNQDYGRELGAG